MKVTRVLCPTDLSEAAAHAAEWAVTLAGYYRADLTALHVVSPMLFAGSAMLSPTGGGSSEHLELERLRKDVAAQFRGASATSVALDVVMECGVPAACILERAAGLRADLVVMGTHGTTGFEHLALGSVTEKVLRNAPCPVMTVPPRAHATSRLPFERLLCAVDFSGASLSAAAFGVSLARESGAALTLLHVLEWPWEEPPAPTLEELPGEQGAALAEFRRYLEATALARLNSLMPVEIPAARVVTQLRNGKAYEQILDVAAKERTDLMVIGVHGRNPVDVALFGSTTNQIVRRATCPVLTLRQ